MRKFTASPSFIGAIGLMVESFHQEDFWSCGYVIARPKSLPISDFPELKGEPIVTASRDLTVLMPDSWCFAQEENDAVRAILGELGLQDHELPALRQWFWQFLKQEEILWPSFFCTSATAKLTLKKFFQEAAAKEELLVLGLGLDSDAASAITNEFEQAASAQERLYVPEIEFLRKRQRLDNTGRFLGYEILCFFAQGGFSCSWYCNYLDREGRQRFGVSQGRYGLLDNLQDAKQIAAYCNLPETAAEPGLWVPVAIMGYES